MKKLAFFYTLFSFVCIHSFAGNLEKFDIKVCQKENSLFISSSAEKGAPKLSDVINRVLKAIIKTESFRTDNCHVKNSYIGGFTEYVSQEDSSFTITEIKPQQSLELFNFFNAPLVIESKIAPNKWLALIEEEFEKN